jgi:hypothetical protein
LAGASRGNSIDVTWREVLERRVVMIDGCTIWHMSSTIELAIGIVVVSVLESNLGRTFPASHVISAFDWHNKVLPAVSTTKKFDAVVRNAVVNLGRLLANIPDEVDIFGQISQAPERSNEVQRDKALGIHMRPEICIFAKILDREVVLDLALQHGQKKRVELMVL